MPTPHTQSVTAVALGALLWSASADARTAQEQVRSIFERGGTPSSATLLECIQDAYQGLAEGTYRVDMQFRTITRTPERPDVTSIGEAFALHRGTDIRFESDSNVTTSNSGLGDIPSFEGAAHERLVFVRRGDEIRALHEGVQIAPGEFATQAYRIDLSGFDPEVREKITGPFATLRKFDLLHVATAISVLREVLRGEFVYVLRTEGEAPLNQDHNITFATFFVEPETCLVLRMEEHVDAFDTNEFMTLETDLAYEIGIDVSRRAFDLQLPPDAVDLTNNPALLDEIERQLAHEASVLGL